MANVVVLKNRLGIEWTLQVSRYNTTYVSEIFSLQSCKCHLEFDCKTNFSCNLYFKSDKELQSPVNTTICISNADGSLHVRSPQIITSANTRIWSYSNSFTDFLITFEIIIHADATKGEFYSFFFSHTVSTTFRMSSN